VKRLFLLLPCILFALACLASGPEATVKRFYSAVEDGEIDKAAEMLSSRIVGMMGKDKLHRALSEQALDIKKKGGIKSLKIDEMTEVGEIAEGKVTLTFGDGSTKSDKVKLIKEEGKWKLDADK
jgi:Domain of unknown function (DUF4878)